MKHYPPRFPRERRRPPPRIPLFHAVPARGRRDGWTPQRQADFIGHLAETRSVTEAARRVSMARETAYRLRRREWSESFCRAWDAALGKPAPAKVTPEGHAETSQPAEALPRKVTNEELWWRIETGLWQVYMYRGGFGKAWKHYDIQALNRLLARLERAKTAGPAAPAG